MGTIWGYYEDNMGYHGDSMGTPWGQYGDTIGVAWEQRGNSVGPQCGAMWGCKAEMWGSAGLWGCSGALWGSVGL